MVFKTHIYEKKISNYGPPRFADAHGDYQVLETLLCEYNKPQQIGRHIILGYDTSLTL